jgi:hypothetical protein
MLAEINRVKSFSISIGANFTRKLSSQPGAIEPFLGKILYGPASSKPVAGFVIIKLNSKWIKEVFLMENL